MSLVIASGCVLNNLIDRDIDQLMERTKNRVLAQGLMSGKLAFCYAILLAALGFGLLFWRTNLLTTFVALVGLVVYVGAYSLWFKRNSAFGTAIGGIAGAVPPIVGYCAVRNQFDMGALILLGILFFWQMPHFYAIAIYRLSDFKAANIPVLPITKGMRYTKLTTLVYIAIFTLVAALPSIFAYTGIIYLSIALGLGLIWFYLGLKGLKQQDDRLWARKMFLFSIIVITVLSFAMAVKA